MPLDAELSLPENSYPGTRPKDWENQGLMTRQRCVEMKELHPLPFHSQRPDLDVPY